MRINNIITRAVACLSGEKSGRVMRRRRIGKGAREEERERTREEKKRDCQAGRRM